MAAWRRHLWPIVVGLVLAAVVAAGVWLYGDVLVVEVTRQPVSTPGANPFMPPAGRDEPGLNSPPDTGGTFPGDARGMYGGNRNARTCDAKQMTGYLQQHPDVAAAWARPVGVQATALASYFATLTPVFLRSDTFVTDHPFESGRATDVPAVLQAGTSVLVDTRGRPAVKCLSGNPLTEPSTRWRRSYVGNTWSAFSPSRVTVVRPAPAPVAFFTLANPRTMEVFERPVGTSGTNDRDSAAQGELNVVDVTGSWRSTNALMTVSNNSGETEFRWTNTSSMGGAEIVGPSRTRCVIPSSALLAGKEVRPTCTFEAGGKVERDLDFRITAEDPQRVRVEVVPSSDFPAIPGIYSRCADPCS
jgi:hypothetical protein